MKLPKPKFQDTINSARLYTHYTKGLILNVKKKKKKIQGILTCKCIINLMFDLKNVLAKPAAIYTHNLCDRVFEVYVIVM